ncbi:poly(R)-hydroxyalkanoic acid synthase subunit PhaE [Serpentinicella sp. ANB-PHB4]|uniref:poly(R)-hydroxyalkanoic acid synthase subunit PhaE n=1 Tax=Serpentinicella sp. ANB-PHB4 TaxID=3074076 RepID=UPI00285E6C1C|nr:poly(R)-hydroxyalkanoic acid synthase subunit PhaE [Serpentinicella sp. ANB-PHB4]MDR5658645.1 poly(R)-hydroxyalkanoic acid synthase subunit PhaE [Serpentinicella sp. ANB-PHB4]
MTSEKIQENFWGQVIDAQKKMFDFWQEGIMPKNNTEDDKVVVMQNVIGESMKPTVEVFKKWVEVANDTYSKNIKSFGDSTYQELINKMVNGVNVYQNLNTFWEDLRTKITTKESDVVKFYSEWKEEYLKICSNNFIPCLPEPVQVFFKEPIDIYAMQTETNKKLLQPWIDSAQDQQDLLAKALTGDKDAYVEFTRLWNDNFGNTFGKLLNVPQMGISREYMQKQMDSLNALIKFLNNINEFSATMIKVNQETLENIVKDYQEKLADGTQPKTFKEFYTYWWTQNEAAYQNLFKTEDFSKLVGQLSDAGVNFKKNFDRLLEKQLEFLPFPTKTDMDSLYKTVNDLRREVRNLSKEVSTLKAESEKPKKTTTTKKTTAKEA